MIHNKKCDENMNSYVYMCQSFQCITL